MAGKGRPKKTVDLAEYQAEYRTKHKNVSLDVDTQQLLQSVQQELSKELGFRPTVSQAVRYLIIKAKPYPQE